MAMRSTGANGVATDIHGLAAEHEDALALWSADRHKEATTAFTQAYNGCRTVLGPQHDATLMVAGNLAVALVLIGRRREGLVLLEQNIVDRVRYWGEDDPRTLTARDAYAVALRLAGRADDAAEMSEEVIDQRTQVLGPTHPDTMTSRMGLVQARAAAGDIGSASALLAGALADAERALGSRHRNTQALLECGRHLGLIRVDG